MYGRIITPLASCCPILPTITSPINFSRDIAPLRKYWERIPVILQKTVLTHCQVVMK